MPDQIWASDDRRKAAEGGGHKDDGKPRVELLSPVALLGVAEVLRFGAKKYGDRNWEKGIRWSRLLGSVLRHTFAFMKGEDLDPESQLPHLDHLTCDAMMLAHLFRTRKDLDDRG